MRKAGLITAIALATAGMQASGLGPELLPIRPPREPKNKFNLTPEQVEAMSDMSPKEKKAYLKSFVGEK